jgi:hypothetical protein
MATGKISRENPERLQLLESDSLNERLMEDVDLLIISTSGWRDVTKAKNTSLPSTPAILILQSAAQ